MSQKKIRMDGLGQQRELMYGAAGICIELIVVRVAREENGLTVGIQVLHVEGQVDAVHARHKDIGDEKLRHDEIRYSEGLITVVGDSGTKSALIQDRRQCVGDEGFVVDH